MERIRKRKGSLMMKHFLRILQREHAVVLNYLKFYKDENDNN